MNIFRQFCQKLRNYVLPRHTLLTIYKAFIRAYLDYSDVICDKIFTESWHKKLESAEYNDALAVTGAFKDINTVKLYQELALESLQTDISREG